MRDWASQREFKLILKKLAANGWYLAFAKLEMFGMKNFLITGLALSLLMACGQAEQSTAGEAKAQNYSWSLVTTWPKKLSWSRNGS